jgi:Type IV secretory pathway, VirB10 components
VAWWDEWIGLPSWFGGFVPADDSNTSRGAFLRALDAIRRAHVPSLPRTGAISMLGGNVDASTPASRRPVVTVADVPFSVVLGDPAPKPSPGPTRRPSRRRRTAPSKRPPARPRRPRPIPGTPDVPTEPPAPKKVEPPPRRRQTPPGPPSRPGMPPIFEPAPPEQLPQPGKVKEFEKDLPPFTINPIEWVLRQYDLYTRPIGSPTTNPRRRGGKRNRPTKFPPVPPIALPAPGPIAVDIPTPGKRDANSIFGPPADDPFIRANVPAGYPETLRRQLEDPFQHVLESEMAVGPPPERAPARPLPRAPTVSPAELFSLSPFPLGGLRPQPKARTSSPRSLRRQQRRRPAERQQLFERMPIGDPLTPVQPQTLGFTRADPTSDPCAVRARDARRRQRRRRKECKKFTTKTIRVCADK